MSQDAYPPNWKQIATALKAASNWRCTRCDRLCLRPDEKAPYLTLSQRKAYTLQVHHWNRDPSDNRLENLVCLYKVAVTFTIIALDAATFRLGSCHYFSLAKRLNHPSNPNNILNNISSCSGTMYKFKSS